MNNEKPQVELEDTIHDKSSNYMLNAAQQDNAVGYKEYREALDLDISEKEVSTLKQRLRIKTESIWQSTDEKTSVEARSYYSSNVSYHASLAIYGQDIPKLCQSFWLPESLGLKRTAVQLSLGE
jgi:hypothetical protein